MMRFSRLYFLLLLGAVASLRADLSKPAGEWDSVTIEPVKTSIYVGNVTLTTSEFKRSGEEYTATYEAKVWPWFWWNETGRITIHLPAAELERLGRGERIEFKGEAFNQKNKLRQVSGRADRVKPGTGKIKVRIAVDGTELIFNSTYRVNNVFR